MKRGHTGQDRSASASNRQDIGRAPGEDKKINQRDTWTKMQSVPRNNCVPAFCSGEVKKSVQFLNYNIDGLLQKIDNSHLIQYTTSHDFVCLTESFIATSFESDLFNDYCIYTAIAKKLSHQGRYSGVVVVMVRKQYSPYVKQISTDLENMIVLK